MNASNAKGILYAAIGIATSTLWGVVNGWLLYFYLPPAATPLIPIALYGLVILLSKAASTSLSLLIGHLSDRTRSRWGRRMPYIVGGAIGLPVLFVLLWTPPHAGESLGNLVYLAVILFALNISYEFFQTPYDALLPELIPDEKGRVGTAAWSTGFQLLGGVLAGLAGPLIERYGYASAALLFAACTAPFLYVPLFFLREAAGRAALPAPGPVSFRESLGLTLRNRALLIFSLAHACFWIGATFILEALPYIVTEICRASEADTIYFFLPAILVSLLCFPLVTWLSDRFGKERIFAFSLLAGAAVMPLLMLIGDHLPLPPLAQGVAWIVLQSAVLSGAQVLPTAIMAEITDRDRSATGQPRQGAIYAFWGLQGDIASGLGSALLPLFLLLGRSGADPQGPLGVRLLGVASGLFLFLGFLVFRRYGHASSKT